MTTRLRQLTVMTEHDHEAEEAHKGASNEIVLTPEKAEAAGVKVETVEPVLSVR